MKKKSIIVSGINQSYFDKILIDYPRIKSGRKNYKKQYIRILKNILLTKLYIESSKNKKNILSSNILFKKNKNHLKLIIKKQ